MIETKCSRDASRNQLHELSEQTSIDCGQHQTFGKYRDWNDFIE